MINGLTDQYHPCQALADLMTFYEHKGGFAGRKLVYVGDGNLTSPTPGAGLRQGGSGFHHRLPQGLHARSGGHGCGRAGRRSDRRGAAHRARPQGRRPGLDAIYTDVWTSMGQEAEKQQRLQDFAGYQVMIS